MRNSTFGCNVMRVIRCDVSQVCPRMCQVWYHLSQPSVLVWKRGPNQNSRQDRALSCMAWGEFAVQDALT